MTEAEKYAYTKIIWSHRTNHITDRVVQAVVIRSARNIVERRTIIRWILEARMGWLDDLAVTQRRWQSSVSKNPCKGRNHDSWATREAYVRCHGRYTDHLPYAHAVRYEAGVQDEYEKRVYANLNK